MSLESILTALEEETQRRVAEVEQAAKAEIERIRGEAQVQAAAIRQQHEAAVQVPLQAERARMLNRTRLEAVRIVMGSRDTLIASVVEEAKRRLAALPGAETYPVILRRLTEEAVSALGPDSEARLRVHDGDIELMKRIAREAGLALVVEGGLEPPGGLVATDSSGRVSVVNTLSGRLQRAMSVYRLKIAQLIFGQHGRT